MQISLNIYILTMQNALLQYGGIECTCTLTTNPLWHHHTAQITLCSHLSLCVIFMYGCQWYTKSCMYSYMMNTLNQYCHCFKGMQPLIHTDDAICQQNEFYICQDHIIQKQTKNKYKNVFTFWNIWDHAKRLTKIYSIYFIYTFEMLQHCVI